ncbi:uncharacterized protein LOC115229553 [Octopus sinensis]|uniref:Uncharacterized protein LOC115229553 n=1 Tax=Octopus sinensis TaxID=2607531 RepID=A0A6P7U2K7_9MOLL|nr:uncharacterized protein LOC115229553 [Octopus sinensis]
MSKAFDCVRRDLLIGVLESFLEVDEVRMIQLLLAKTELLFVLGQSLPGGSKRMSTRLKEIFSPLLFVIYLEAALRDLRIFYNDSITEIVYADDVDFASDNIDDLIHLLNNFPRMLNKWFLIINTSKTEVTEIKRMDTRIGETWWNVKKLGSLLGDSEDISRRKMLAPAALTVLTSKIYEIKRSEVCKMIFRQVKSLRTVKSSKL